MATQYSDASSLPSATYRDYVLSFVGPFDHYVIFQSGQYEYIGYVWNKWGKDVTIRIYRVGVGSYNYRWTVDVTNSQTLVNINEPMYCYSSESELGTYYMPQTVSAAGSIASLVLSCTIAVIFIFRGVWGLCGKSSRSS